MGGNSFSTTLCFFLLEVLKNTRLSLILNSVLIVSLASCSKDSVSEKFPKMDFQTNLVLLSDKTEFNNLSLRIPRSFNAVNSEDFALLKNGLENQPKSIFSTSVLGAFSDTIGATIIISEILNTNVLEKLDDEFNDALTAAGGGNEPIRSQFSINSLPVVHYQIFNNLVINVKIYLLIEPVLQLDFIVPRDSYYDYQTSIESLLGTLKIINQ